MRRAGNKEESIKYVAPQKVARSLNAPREAFAKNGLEDKVLEPVQDRFLEKIERKSDCMWGALIIVEYDSAVWNQIGWQRPHDSTNATYLEGFEIIAIPNFGFRQERKCTCGID